MSTAFIEEVRETALHFTEPPSRTWRLDLQKNHVVQEIDELEAVVQAAYMALQTQRYTYPVFSWQYGSELQTLIGAEPDYALSEAKRMIADTLLPDTRIKEVRNFLMQDGILYFTLDTIFGISTVSAEVFLQNVRL